MGDNNNQTHNNQQGEEQNTNNQNNQNTNVQNTNNTNVETKDTLAEFMKKNGIDSEEELTNFWTQHKEDVESKKDDLTKAQDTIKETTKQLVEERKARMEADAKLTAIKLGAKPELVDDLVVIAMSRVSETKDINAVLTEIKSGNSGKTYFVTEEEGKEKNKNRNVTRANSQNSNASHENKSSTNNENNNSVKHRGTMAERLLNGRKTNKPFYFK